MPSYLAVDFLHYNDIAYDDRKETVMRRQNLIKVVVHLPDDREAFQQLFVDAVFDSIVQLARTASKSDLTDEKIIIIQVSLEKLIEAMWEYDEMRSKGGVKANVF